MMMKLYHKVRLDLIVVQSADGGAVVLLGIVVVLLLLLGITMEKQSLQIRIVIIILISWVRH